VTAFLVIGSIAFVFVQLQPGLLFLDTTPAGGDMGAHVWAPAFLRDHLLPHLRLSGWTPDWYDGFPVYVFYMVVPSLLIVLLDVVFFLPYNVAFKLVSVSGLLALPVAAWALGRLARLPFPYPAALAVASVPFVFERSFTIYGGNAASTLAGEFAFTISMAFALVFLGVVYRGLDTGKSRAAAAVLLGLTVTCHLIPAVFALVGALVILAFSVDWTRLGSNRSRLWWFASAVGTGALLTAFWTLPFYANRHYMTDMGWEKLHNFLQLLFPGRIGDWSARRWDSINTAFGGASHHVQNHAIPGDMTLVIALAVVGVCTSIAFRRRFGLWLTAMAAVLAVLIVVAPQGRLWNARLLPFWYLILYFLAATAVVELIGAVATLLTTDGSPHRGALIGGPIAVALFTAFLVALPLWTLPFGHTSKDGRTYSWMGISTTDHSFVPGWAKWNYKGYEKKDAYPEYHAVVSAMDRVGKQHGCGRAMWEYDKTLDRFGTPMALMLLPYWTDGCIGSMEGLYFEASATTPYHFINQSELSAGPSRAERDLPYGELDVALGVNHLQLLGVKYYMAFSDAAVAQADKDPNLELTATTGKWHVYEVAGSDVVQPLKNRPAVVRGVKKGGATWQDMAVDWYVKPSAWAVMRAADGPSAWQRIDESGKPTVTANPTTKVSRIKTTTDTITFQVDRPGTPMLVKASYFPNWKASNAEGPYRVAPNLMVVIPTGKHVTLHYARTSTDWLAIVLTLLGVALTVALARRRGLLIPPRVPRVRRAPQLPPEADEVLATVGGGAPDPESFGPPPE
jgi:hypothetical protein